MPGEPWRNDREYLGLWRESRRQPDEGPAHLVLADWLDEHDHATEAWCERLHGLTGYAPELDLLSGTVRAGKVPMIQGSWGHLLASTPPEGLVTVFERDVNAYRYLRKYPGRFGLEMGLSDWSSQTERGHLLALSRLEMLACELVDIDTWDWIIRELPGLTHFEAFSPEIDAARLASLKQLPRLRTLALAGEPIRHTTAVDSLPGVRHFSIAPAGYRAGRIAELVPGAESIQAELLDVEAKVYWPRLRSFRVWPYPIPFLMDTDAVKAMALHPLLECLALRCGEVTEAAIQAVAELPHLRELALRFPGGQVPSLKALARAPVLESLTVEGAVTDARLAEVASLPRLRSLTLGDLDVSGRALTALAELRSLEVVCLHGTKEPPGGLLPLVTLPRLVKLDVSRLKMSPVKAAALKAGCSPWVECLLYEGKSVTQVGEGVFEQRRHEEEEG
jgi:uncharacterized protein (TIGR02996 family)